MDYLRPVMYCYLLFAVMNTVLSVLRGAGDVAVPHDYQPFVLVDYPAADRLPAGVFLWKRVSLFSALAPVGSIGMVMAISYYFSGRWKKKAVVSQQVEEELREKYE